MTNILVHYAIGVTIASLFGIRAKWTWGLLAVLPDIDGLTAFLVEPVLHARSWSPAAAQAIAFTLAHRGLLHTLGFVFAASFLAGLLRGWTRALSVCALVGSHLAFDALSPWPLEPLWPITSANLHVGLLRVDDPAEIVAAILALAAMWVGGRSVERRSFAPRRLTFLAATVLLLPYAISAASAADVAQRAEGVPTILKYPRYQVVERTLAGYNVSLLSVGGAVDERIAVQRVGVESNTTPDGTRALDVARCELEELGPLRWINDPVFRVTRAEGHWAVTVTEARAQQDPKSAPASMVFDIAQEGVVRVRAFTGEDGFHGERDLDLPGSVAKHAGCMA